MRTSYYLLLENQLLCCYHVIDYLLVGATNQPNQAHSSTNVVRKIHFGVQETSDILFVLSLAGSIDIFHHSRENIATVITPFQAREATHVSLGLYSDAVRVHIS